MSLGITEIILIIIVVLVLFGGKKIPELARGLGRAQAEYKKAKEAIESELKAEVKKRPAPAKKTSVKKTPVQKKTSETKKSSMKKTSAAKKPAKKATAKKSAK